MFEAHRASEEHAGKVHLRRCMACTSRAGDTTNRQTPSQVESELWRFPDRTTVIGQMIDGYLASNVELDDAAVHLLFSSNRWEKRYVVTGI